MNRAKAILNRADAFFNPGDGFLEHADGDNMSRQGQTLIAQRFIAGNNVIMISSPVGMTDYYQFISIENITLVILDSVFFQKHQKFRLKIHFAVMFALIFNVFKRCVQCRRCQSKTRRNPPANRMNLYGKCFVNPFYQPPFINCIPFATLTVEGNETSR